MIHHVLIRALFSMQTYENETRFYSTENSLECECFSIAKNAKTFCWIHMFVWLLSTSVRNKVFYYNFGCCLKQMGEKVLQLLIKRSGNILSHKLWHFHFPWAHLKYRQCCESLKVTKNPLKQMNIYMQMMSRSMVPLVKWKCSGGKSEFN